MPGKRRITTAALTLFLFIFLLFYNAAAQEADPEEKAEPGDQSSLQEAFQKDMALINQMMLQNKKQEQPEFTVKGVELDIGDNPVKGSPSAGIIVVEFSDYACHYCSRHVRETYPDICKQYIETGKIRYVVIDSPLPGDFYSIRASEAAHCANDQGKYWEMHEEIMSDQESLNNVNSYALSLGLDMDEFNMCVKSEKYKGRVISNINLVSKLKITSVPRFIIASVDPDNPQKIKGISYIRGAKSFSRFKQEIDDALDGSPK